MLPQPVSCLVEGVLDEAVVRRIFAVSSLDAGVFYRRSLPAFKTYLQRFNQAANTSCWFAVCDLDRVACAPIRLKDFLPHAASGMCFRIAVRSIEAWLLADRSSLARFLSVSMAAIPHPAEDENEPKARVIALARRSRSRAIREGMVPAEGDVRSVGPEYVSMMGEYVRERWDPQRAAAHAPSLSRTLERCRTLAITGRW
ncbi:MAG: hypothetical protein OXQ31_02710 [Spirochaetaceae bacterium]|nr:hypothetical protein [Spirochaetaceae bacterium]